MDMYSNTTTPTLIWKDCGSCCLHKIEHLIEKPVGTPGLAFITTGLDGRSHPIQKNGGNIICILNAETIDNPCTNRRKALVQKLEKYQADISYYDDAFDTEDVDRKTNVRIAVVKVQIPETEFSSQIYEKLKQKQYSELQIDEEITDVAVNDLVKNIVKQYELEVDAGIALIREYKGMKKYIMSSIKENYAKRMAATIIW